MNKHENLCDIIIFGGHGDLAFRKLMPALYHLCHDGYFHQDTRIITVSRADMNLEEHLALVKTKLKEFLIIDKYDEEKFNKFKKKLHIVKIDISDEEKYTPLAEILAKYPDRDRINYLSTSPSFFGTICKALSRYELILPSSRVVLEKPIGRDLKSSRAINVEVLQYFQECQIYRIDHYLGKDTVQNILALRFSNRIFMPLWDANNIDHVQILLLRA